MLTPPASDPSNDRISDEAANWCMRVNEPDFTEQERDQLNRWLNSDPAHQREYDAMLEIWTISEFLPTNTPVPHTSRPRRAHKRPLMVAAALVLALPLAGWLGWQLNVIPDSYQRFESGSSTRDITLADGSHVQMNLGSQLSFANFKDRRSVTLSRGEAYFEAVHDASHPFLVNAGAGQVKVLGTHFNVWTYQGQVVVTLTQGSVQVMGDRGKPDELVTLSPGMQARYDRLNTFPALGTASASQALAWREGKLILNDLPLSEALPQMNRYLDSPIHLGDRATGQLRIGGVYNTSNIAGLVQTLPKVLPVYLSRNDQGETVIRSKSSPVR